MSELGGYYGGSDRSGFNSLFSYDLCINDISPDRQMADESSVRQSIRTLLLHCENTDVHKKVIRTAARAPEKNFEEYWALNNTDQENGMNFNMLRNIGYNDVSESMSGSLLRFTDKINYIGSSLGRSYVIDSGTLGAPLFKSRNPGKNHSVSANEQRWKNTFYELFGEKAVLESGDADDNKDAEVLGYNVIKVNSNVAKFLKSVGVKSSDNLFNVKKVYKWANKHDLSKDEASLLDLIPEINNVVLGHDLETHVKVYEGQYMITESEDGQNMREEKEIKTDGGFYTNEDPENPSKDLIGIKRNQFESKHDFMKTYIHELGHKITGVGDYDRRFTDFFVDALSKMTAHYMDKTFSNQH